MLRISYNVERDCVAQAITGTAVSAATYCRNTAVFFFLAKQTMPVRDFVEGVKHTEGRGRLSIVDRGVRGVSPGCTVAHSWK